MKNGNVYLPLFATLFQKMNRVAYPVIDEKMENQLEELRHFVDNHFGLRLTPAVK